MSPLNPSSLRFLQGCGEAAAAQPPAAQAPGVRALPDQQERGGQQDGRQQPRHLRGAQHADARGRPGPVTGSPEGLEQ